MVAPQTIVVVVILAITLDLAVMFWLQRRHTRRFGKKAADEKAVYLFGAYSPVLSWLKKRLGSGGHFSFWRRAGSQAIDWLKKCFYLTPIPPPEPDPPESVTPVLSVDAVLNACWKSTWLEWGFIILAVLAFCTGFLDLRANTSLPGAQAEIFQSLDWVLVNSLRQGGQFPLWNPYIGTGRPYVGDPLLHAYNPVVTLPVLFFGVHAGFKLAMFLSFCLAALGMWWLANTLGMGRAARLWTALMFAFAGQPAARFFSGEYLIVLAFAWLPWIFSSLFLVWETGQRRYIALSALFLAVFFFSGDLYASFFMLWAGGLFFLAMFVYFRARPPFVALSFKSAWPYVLVALLAVGLAAVQLFPLVRYLVRLDRSQSFLESHAPLQVIWDYVSKEPSRLDAYGAQLDEQEFYAYIGLVPFVALCLLPLVLRNLLRDRDGKADGQTRRALLHTTRPLIFFLLLVMFTVVWAGLDAIPWFSSAVLDRAPALFLETTFYRLLRVLNFGGLALITLAGSGLHALWQILRGLSVTRPEKFTWNRASVAAYLGHAGLLLLAVAMALGVIDVYVANRKFLSTQTGNHPADQVVSWMNDYLGCRENGCLNYLVRTNLDPAWLKATISNGLRNLGGVVFVEFGTLQVQPIATNDRVFNRRYLAAEPHYLFQSSLSEPPVEPDQAWVAQIADWDIWRLTQSLPMAFSAPDELLKSDGEQLKARDVSPLEPFFSGPNEVEIIASGDNFAANVDSDAEDRLDGRQVSGNKLVVLITHYPGWQLEVDGKRQPAERIISVGGYLATDLLPGVHRYQFSYRPTLFFTGLLFHLAVMSVIVYWLVSDLILSRQVIRQRWLRVAQSGLRLRDWLAGWLRLPELVRMAVLRQGALFPDLPLPLPEESRVRLTVEALAGQEALGEEVSSLALQARRWLWTTILLVKAVARVICLEPSLFMLAIGIYLLTRLIGLTQFPIYFFSDEAMRTLLAADLLQHGLVSQQGEFLPTFFLNVDKYSMGFGVYLQLIPYLLFGKSVFFTRLTSVLVTLLAAISVGLTMRDIFRQPYWWIVTLLLSITPAWFLHSRTAFEVELMVSFYAAALYFYLLYRYRNPRRLYASLVFFALAFYSYSPGQVVVVLTSLLLLVSDLRYHWQNRSVGFRGIGLLLVLMLPYIRFQLAHPTATANHLVMLNSYWIQPLSLQEKLGQFWSEYRLGLSPSYWFFPNGRDLERHVMKGYGNILRFSLPFVLLGILICLKEIRSSAHRLLLLSMLAAPAGAAVAQMAVTRALAIVIPVNLLAALGLITVIRWLEKGLSNLIKPKPGWLQGIVALILLVSLGTANFWMLSDALINGPIWFQDYGMMGMQYGASQLYGAVQDYLDEHPDTNVVVSPNWANGPETLAKFFLDTPLPFRIGSIDEYMRQYLPLDETSMFVMTPDEFRQVQESGKFKHIRVEQTLPYPTGQPGFYFVRLTYVNDIEAILAAERAARRQLQESEFSIDGRTVRARYSMLDIGNIAAILDGDSHSLTRTLEANPYIIELTFPEERSLSGLSVIIGDTTVKLLVRLYEAPDAPPVEYVFDVSGSPQEPGGSVDFGTTHLCRTIYLEITDLHQGEPGHVHLWELGLR